MTEDHLFAIISILIGLFANGIATLLFWRIKRMDTDIEQLKSEINNIRMNYLNRFQDVKDHNTTLHLQMLDKFSTVEKGLAAHYAVSQAREKINIRKDLDSAHQ